MSHRFSTTNVHAVESEKRPTAALMPANPDGSPEWIAVTIPASSVEFEAFEDGQRVMRVRGTNSPTTKLYLSIANASALRRMLACCLAKPGDSCPQCDGTGEGPDRPHTRTGGFIEDVPSECWDCAGQGVVQLVEGERDPAPPVLTMEDAIRMMSA